MGFREDALAVIEEAGKAAGGLRALERETGVSCATLSNWLKQKKDPTLTLLAAVFDHVGATVCMPDKTTPAPNKPDKLDRQEALEREVIALRAQVDVLERVAGISQQKEKNVG